MGMRSSATVSRLMTKGTAEEARIDIQTSPIDGTYTCYCDISTTPSLSPVRVSERLSAERTGAAN
ncbi:MAG: hypothetical protein ABGZ23_12105 [Fuerstiella sp.]